MISVPAWLRSMYLGSLPWCTRWWLGVLRTHSNGPSFPMALVWIQNWYSVLKAPTVTMVSGWKPNQAMGR